MRGSAKGRKRILFIAEHIKQAHGSALSAIDVLRSIPSSYQKYILTEHRIANGRYLHGAIRLSCTCSVAKVRPRFIGKPVSKLFSRLYSVLFKLWLRYAEFDLVIVNGFGSRSLWEKARLIINSSNPSCVISRESPRHFDSGDRNHSLIEQIVFLRTFDSHIFVSRSLNAEWTELANLNEECSHYLPNCCEEEQLLSIDCNRSSVARIRAKYAIAPDIPLILNVGTIELRKGQQDLEVLAHHLIQSGQDFRIACVGFVGTEDGALIRKRIEESALSNFFLFPGQTGQIQLWYQAATMLVFTSRAEAMPRTILESMASALPIVSTNVDGIPELISHLDNGYLYAPGDTCQMIQGVENMLKNPRWARDLGSRARQKYINNFSKDHHAMRMREILAAIGC
jgi:glycosyltransferase involved in cell wall biosynthesis